MNHRLAAGCVLAVLGLGAAAAAQGGLERLPDEVLRQHAPRIIELIARSLPNPGLRITGDPEKCAGYRAEGIAAVLVPDRALSGKTVEEAGEKPSPVGFLVLRGLAPVIQGQRVPSNRLATVKPDGDERELTVLFLGVRRDGERRVLEIFAQDPKPLTQIPVVRKEAAEAGARILDARFAQIDQQVKQADFVITVAGAREATLRLGAAD